MVKFFQGGYVFKTGVVSALIVVNAGDEYVSQAFLFIQSVPAGKIGLGIHQETYNMRIDGFKKLGVENPEEFIVTTTMQWVTSHFDKIQLENGGPPRRFEWAETKNWSEELFRLRLRHLSEGDINQIKQAVVSEEVHKYLNGLQYVQPMTVRDA